MAGRETIQLALFDFLIDLADLTMMSEDSKRPCDKYSELEEPRTLREAWEHQDQF